ACGDAAGSTPRILASDRDAGAVRAAQANAERAGVSELIEFSCKALSAVEPPPAPGWIVTNPPYGVRLKESGDLRDLYARFGQVLREKCPGWHAAVLCGDLRLMRSAALSYKTELLSMSGGLKVSLAVVR
ncbi:MAG: class I SAM-dependent RNA methyltransferase, partial [Elusimicrobiota bacterium]